jgi:hypothetical protein
MVMRRGVSSLGCLLPLLILAVAAYFAVDAFEAYFDFYRFKDTMGQEARFAGEQSDERITKRLAALADSLELPPGAEQITIERTPQWVTISSSYVAVIPLPFNREKVIHFNPIARSKP